MNESLLMQRERRVLVLTPVGRDAPLTVEALEHAGMSALAVGSLPELLTELAHGASVLLIASEALLDTPLEALSETLATQPPWSELPIVLLTPSVDSPEPLVNFATNLGPPGNITFLERPLTLEVLIGTVRFAWRSRLRQYQTRDLLQQLDVRTHALEQANGDLERSNHDLERFAYVAAHDFQEPLRMITNHLGIIQRTCLAQLDEKARDHFRFAIDGSQRMRRMLEALLGYAKVGRSEEPMAPCPLERVIAGALRNLDIPITTSPCPVQVQAQLPVVMGHEVLLVQLCQNLIANALKFTATGVAPEIEIGASTATGSCEVYIRDHGIGIPPGDRERIFDLFQRLHAVHEYPGSGIGLSTCRRIVDIHRGRIWAEATPGGGSTFRFTIPLCAAQKDPQSTPVLA